MFDNSGNESLAEACELDSDDPGEDETIVEQAEGAAPQKVTLSAANKRLAASNMEELRRWLTQRSKSPQKPADDLDIEEVDDIDDQTRRHHFD